MRKGGGKAKGASFEREICVDLSRWVSGGKIDDCFWRSAVSGGRSTVAAKTGRRLAAQVGDISCIHEAGMLFANLFMIECKFYADLQLGGLVTGKGHLIDFWKIAQKEAARCYKHPLLVAKQNRVLAQACLDPEGAEALKLEKRSLLIAPSHNLCIIPWHEFLANAVRP